MPVAVPDLVARKRVAGYPTNFAPKPEEALRALTKRGEQLTRALISNYCPELGAN